MTLHDKILAYYQARELYEHLDEQKKRAYGRMKGLESELIDAMLESNTRSLSLDDGTNVGLRRNVDCSVTLANSDDIRRWLIDTVGDDSDFVEERVSKSAVRELVKRGIEEDGQDEQDYPDFLSVSTRPTIQVRGWKGRVTE